MIFKTRNLFLAQLLGLSLLLGAFNLCAAVPQVLNHQGRVSVGGKNFDGSGQFKFALVDGEGTTSFWSNDGTSNEGGEPTNPVTLAVTKGLYSVLLGDDTLDNMTVIPVSALDNGGVRLRVWFSDGSNGFQQFSPDQRLAATPYAIQAVEATGFSGSLAGDVTGTQGATAISASTVTGKLLTGYVSSAGTISSSDSILNAINKLNGNDALKAPLASPTFTGTVSGITKSMVGLGNVDNTADVDKPVSTAQQEALDLRAPLASPTFTGTVSGITKSMVGLGNVDNTADADKPISDLTQAALDEKQAAGNYVTLVDGVIPVSQLALTLDNITAAPALPVIAFGRNDLGQTTVPSLANVAEIAARESHSLVLLKDGTVVTWGNGPSVPADLESVAAIAAGSSHDLGVKSNGTVVAWGDNTFGQTAVPSGITTATQAAAGEKHSLILSSAGAVTAWGNNSFGQTTVPVAASTNVIAIAAGYDHSLALKADGTVVAWGRSDAGQINVPFGLSNVIAIAAGAYHSLAVKSDGKVVAWGWNNGGQSTVPTDLSGVTKVTGGYAFSAALKADGTLVAWGDNSYGQITIPATATQVAHIAAGDNHMLALRDDLVSAQLARLDQDNVFTGKVGIGRIPTTNTLEVAGNASKSIAGSWLSNSDRRIKTDVKAIAGGLEKLAKVRLVDFRYTDDYLAAHPEIDDKRYPNVIAQEFAEVFPDHVKESGEFLVDGSPILQVDTYPLTIYSAVAVQELHRDSLELQKQNELLRQQLRNQEDRLDKLEALLESR